VKTTKPEAAAAARIGAGLGRRKRYELLELLRPCFARVEPWLQAGKYAAALMGDLPRRNGWTLAEWAGDRAPDRMQRLLGRAVWDTAAAMRVVRRFAVAGLDQAVRTGGRRGLLAVGAVDETSQVKQGERTAGVKRHGGSRACNRLTDGLYRATDPGPEGTEWLFGLGIKRGCHPPVGR
jgi:hypothetical protein